MTTNNQGDKAMSKKKELRMSGLDVLIAEIEAHERSLSFNLAGYTQGLPDGKEHFCCKICGHSPALLIERLKAIKEQS